MHKVVKKLAWFPIGPKPPPGVVGGGEPGEPVYVFQANPALAGSDPNNNTTFRVELTLAAPLLDEVRVSILPGNTNALTILNASFAKRDVANWPNDANATATPLELLFGGASGFAGATTLQTSDWRDCSSLSVAAGEKVLAIFDIANLGVAQAACSYNNAATNAKTFFKQAAQSYSAIASNGQSFSILAGWNFCIASVETRSAGGGAAQAASFADGETAPSGFHWEFVTDTDSSQVTDDTTTEPIVDLEAD
jgi:hypothetical protein